MVKTYQKSISVVFHLVYKGEILALPDFVRQDGTEGGLYRIQKHSLDEFGESKCIDGDV